MGTEIFFQAFENGDAGRGDAAAVRAALAPYADEAFERVVTADGDAEIVGLDDGDGSFLAAHAGGRLVWDVLYAAAARGGLVALPVGCPVAITDPAQRAHLPPELAEDAGVVLVTSGADLLRVVTEE